MVRLIENRHVIKVDREMERESQKSSWQTGRRTRYGKVVQDLLVALPFWAPQGVPAVRAVLDGILGRPMEEFDDGTGYALTLS